MYTGLEKQLYQKLSNIIFDDVPKHRPGKNWELGNLIAGKFCHLEGNCCLWNKEIHKKYRENIENWREILQSWREILIRLRFIPGKFHIFSSPAKAPEKFSSKPIMICKIIFLQCITGENLYVSGEWYICWTSMSWCP